MSSKNIQSNVENSLLAILTVTANCFGDRFKFAFHSNGELEEDPRIVGDSVAFSIAQELKEGFTPEDDAITNLGTALRMMSAIISDVEGTRASLMEHTIDRIIYDFFCWLKEAKRVTISLGLFEAWIQVHPSEVARDLGFEARNLLAKRMPQLVNAKPLLLAEVQLENVMVEQEQRIMAKFGIFEPPPTPEALTPGKELPA